MDSEARFEPGLRSRIVPIRSAHRRRHWVSEKPAEGLNEGNRLATYLTQHPRTQGCRLFCCSDRRWNRQPSLVFLYGYHMAILQAGFWLIVPLAQPWLEFEEG